MLATSAACEPLDAVAQPRMKKASWLSASHTTPSPTRSPASSPPRSPICSKEKSGGKITAHVYPSGQLGSDKELIQSCISGDVEFVVQNHSAQVNDITGAKVLDMPYLFPNIDIAREALDDPEFRGVYDALYPEVGLKLLMISDMATARPRRAASWKPSRILRAWISAPWKTRSILSCGRRSARTPPR